MATKPLYTVDFSEIGMQDLPRVGGKNASLGQLFNNLKPLGVGVLDGFATTAQAYRRLLDENGLEARLRAIFAGLNHEDVTQLAQRGAQARAAVLETNIPDDIKAAAIAAYAPVPAPWARAGNGSALLRYTASRFPSCCRAVESSPALRSTTAPKRRCRGSYFSPAVKAPNKRPITSMP